MRSQSAGERQVRGASSRGRKVLEDFVTLVTGAPRSGTSLLMQMLAAGGMPVLADDARPPDADNPRGYLELAAVKATRRDARWLDAAAGRAVKVVHALLPFLPADRPYRVLSMQRAWDEVLASQRAMLHRRGESADPADDAVVARVLAGQADAARRWAERAPGARWLEVSHAELVARPRVVAGAVCDFLGADLDRSAMADRVDPALHRQRGGARR
jgi:hypothetical protein